MATQMHLFVADPGPATTPETVRSSGRMGHNRTLVGKLPVVPLDCRWYPRVKAVAEFIIAVLSTIPALPLIVLAALAVKLTSRGPVFYTQTRVGKDGKLFTIFKLRTMIHDCESLTGPRWCMPGDPRVTVVGWLLRKTHIDELPQLLNVLRGDMGLIGPRPERPEFIPDLERALPVYRQRLNIRPGVTGLAQVQLPPDTDIESVRHKLAHDLFYIRQLGPWMDARLLICTALYALGLPFRVIGRLLGLPASTEIERSTRDLVPDVPTIRPRLSA